MINRSVRQLSIAFLCIICCIQVAYAQGGLTPQQKASVDQAVLREMQNQQAVGVAVGIVDKGQIIYLNGFGWEDRENQIPISSKTMFRWASMSKSLTAVAAMQLVEQGKLDLNADIRGYVPEFPDKGVVITPLHLLCHQSGIPHYHNGKIIRTERKYDSEHPFEDVILALDKFKDSPLLFKPGEKYSYSSYGYNLLSAVAQRAGQEKFADQVHYRIAEPLGMQTLQPDYQWVPIEHRAVGYTKQSNQIVRDVDEDVSWKLGGGGFISNVEDLTRFAQGLLQARVLSPQTLMQMWQPQRTTNGDATSYGLGFQVSRKGSLRVAHGGSQEKVKARFVLYPETSRGVVVFSNCDYAEPGRFTTAVFEVLAQK